MHFPKKKTLLFSKTIFTVIFSVHCIQTPHQFVRISLDETRNIQLCFGEINPKYYESLRVYVFQILSTEFMFLHVIYQGTFNFVLGNTNWFHMETPVYTFVFSREKARGTAANKHDISVCIEDILCTFLRKRLCFSPKPFFL